MWLHAKALASTPSAREKPEQIPHSEFVGAASRWLQLRHPCGGCRGGRLRFGCSRTPCCRAPLALSWTGESTDSVPARGMHPRRPWECLLVVCEGQTGQGWTLMRGGSQGMHGGLPPGCPFLSSSHPHPPPAKLRAHHACISHVPLTSTRAPTPLSPTQAGLPVRVRFLGLTGMRTGWTGLERA